MSVTETAVSEEPTSDEQANGVPWRSPTLVALLAATLLTPMDVPLVSPALTEIQTTFGVSASQAGLFVSAYALPGILLAPAIGSLADRLGRRDVLAGCLVVYGLAGTAVAFTNDFTVALTLRVLQGFAAGSILSALAMTVVGDTYDGRRHDAVMGVTSATLSLGTAVYPVLGGYLATRAWNAPFVLYALALPVAGVVLSTLDGDHAAGSARTGSVRAALREVPTRRTIGLYAVMFVSFALVFGGLYTVLPFYLAAQFGLAPAAVGLVTNSVLVVTGIVSTQNGRLAARLSTTALLRGGFALYTVGFLGVALADDLVWLVGALLLFGAGSGLVTPTLFAAISSLAPDRVRGSVMSLQTTTIGASQAVGPAVFTGLGTVVGYQTALLGASGGAAISTVALAVVAVDRSGPHWREIEFT